MSAVRRRLRHTKGQQRDADVNVQPMMNLFMVLVPLLLLGAVFAELTVFGLNLPTYNPNVKQRPVEVEEPTLEIRVGVTVDGFTVGTTRGPAVSVPKAKSGDYDPELLYNTLTTVLREAGIKPGTRTEAEIAAQSRVQYKAVIAAVDCAKAAGFETISVSLLED